MAKIHFRRSEKATVIACATDPYRNNGRPSQRSTYRCVAVNGPQVVSAADFPSVPNADRCSHCEDFYKIIRARLQRERGMELTEPNWAA
jgi:hypothetical protein